MKTRKEIKNEYKEKKQKIGIFQIRNVVNNKILVGSSMNLDSIWNRHLAELKFGNHRNRRLQEDWNKFGEENFRFEIISVVKQDEKENADYKKEVKELEKLFLEELQPFGEKGYN
jgi:group I intron endonuclease